MAQSSTQVNVEAFTSPLWVAVLVVADWLTPFRLVDSDNSWHRALRARRCLCDGRLRSSPTETSRVRSLFPSASLYSSHSCRFGSSSRADSENGLVFAWLGLCLWVLRALGERGRRSSPDRSVTIVLGWAGSCGLNSPSTASCSSLSSWWSVARDAKARTTSPHSPLHWRYPPPIKYSVWAISGPRLRTLRRRRKGPACASTSGCPISPTS